MYIVEVGNIHKTQKVGEFEICFLFDELRKILQNYCPKHVEEFLAAIKEGLRMWRNCHSRVLLGWCEGGRFHCRYCEGLPEDFAHGADQRAVFIYVEEADDPLWFQVRVERALKGGDWR